MLHAAVDKEAQNDEQPGRRPPRRRKPQECNARWEQGNQDRDKLVEAATKLTLKLADEPATAWANRLVPLWCSASFQCFAIFSMECYDVRMGMPG